MSDPRELRNKRLINEHKELMRTNGKLIEIEPIGNTPYERYKITFNIRTIIDAKPKYSDKTVCTLTLPISYPFAPPRITPDTAPPINRTWHDGIWCVGHWNREESLVSCVIRCARTLQSDPEISGYSHHGTFVGKDLWEETKANDESILNDAQILSALDELESIVIHKREKHQIAILPKTDVLKISINKSDEPILKSTASELKITILGVEAINAKESTTDKSMDGKQQAEEPKITVIKRN